MSRVFPTDNDNMYNNDQYNSIIYDIETGIDCDNNNNKRPSEIIIDKDDEVSSSSSEETYYESIMNHARRRPSFVKKKAIEFNQKIDKVDIENNSIRSTITSNTNIIKNNKKNKLFNFKNNTIITIITTIVVLLIIFL
jgi:hypothetical protein